MELRAEIREYLRQWPPELWEGEVIELFENGSPATKRAFRREWEKEDRRRQLRQWRQGNESDEDEDSWDEDWSDDSEDDQDSVSEYRLSSDHVPVTTSTEPVAGSQPPLESRSEPSKLNVVTETVPRSSSIDIIDTVSRSPLIRSSSSSPVTSPGSSRSLFKRSSLSLRFRRWVRVYSCVNCVG